jgi:stage IV sporulation protein FB
MKWSWKLGTAGAAAWYVHSTFGLLALWLVASRLLGSGSQYGWRQALQEILFVLSVLVAVLLHELGHLLVARHYGLGVLDILLLPTGGVSRLVSLPERLRLSQDLVMALTGPAVNLLVAAALWGYMMATGAPRLPRPTLLGGELLPRLFWVNVALAGINLAPALPLDGGRLLRAVLARRGDPVTAAARAAGIGQGLAVVLGIAGLFVGPLLVFVALCLWIGAVREIVQPIPPARREGIPVRQAMSRAFRTLRPDETLAVPTGYVLGGFAHDFPVEEAGRLIGMLPRGDLLMALARHGEEALVSAVMRRDFQVVAPTERLVEVVQRMRQSACHALPVVENDQVIGLVTMDTLGEFLISQAGRRRGRLGQRP